MNIGFVIAQTSVGGMERQVAYLSKSISEMGHKAFVYTIGPNFLARYKQRVDITRALIYPLYSTKYTRKIAIKLFEHYITTHKIDVLIAFQLGSIELCNKVNQKFKNKIKIISNIRGAQFAFNQEIANKYRNECLKTDAIISNSTIVMTLVENNICNGYTIRKKVIKNIVIPPKNFMQKKTDKFIVLFSASLKKVKDPFTFLKGLTYAMNCNKNITALIAGDGPMKNEMIAYVKKNELQDKVSFLGALKPEEVPYADSHLLVSSSLREASSNSILEAMVNENFIIGTNVGGTPELITDNAYGALFEVGNYKDLGEEMLKYARIPYNERHNRTKIARDYILANHNKDRITNEYIEFCNVVINSKP